MVEELLAAHVEASRLLAARGDELCSELATWLADNEIAEAEDVSLDQLALTALIECAEVDALDRTIAGGLGHELGDELFFPDYLLRMLQAVGLTTVAEVREGVRIHAGAIVAMARPYFQYAWSAWRLTPTRDERALRGYALFFLAHVHVLDGAKLNLDKVERLTRLYRELDYPDDARAAQRVASGLIEAL